MPKHKVYHTLQAGRGIAALAVVVHHTADILGVVPRYWRNLAYAHFFYGGALGVEFFFVLSGIVMMFAHSDDPVGMDSVRNFLWKRFRRIYPIYWFVLFFVAAGYAFRPDLALAHERDVWVLLSSALLVHIHSVDTTVHVAWTLFQEVLFYFFFALVLLHRRFGLCMMTIWMVTSLFFLFGFFNNSWRDTLFTPLNALFGLGMLSAWVLRKRVTLPWQPLVMVGLSLIAYVLILSARTGTLPTGPALLGGVGSASLIMGLIELERRKRLTVWPALTFLGDASYSIYLLHFPMLSLLMRPIYRLSLHLHGPIWLWGLIAALLATGSGIALHLAVERPLLKLLPRSLKISQLSNEPMYQL